MLKNILSNFQSLSKEIRKKIAIKSGLCVIAIIGLVAYWCKFILDSWFVKDLVRMDVAWLYVFVGIVLTTMVSVGTFDEVEEIKELIGERDV